VRLEPAKPLNVPVGLPPGNYIHIKEKNGSVKEKILLDLSFPPPPPSVLPPAAQGEDIPNLRLESHNGSVSGEVWVLRAKEVGTGERVHLYLRSHNGSVKADVVRFCPFCKPSRLPPLILAGSTSTRRRSNLVRSSASKRGRSMVRSR